MAACSIYWSERMDCYVYDNTMTYGEYCEKVNKIDPELANFDPALRRMLSQEEFEIIIGKFAKVIDSPFGLDGDRVVTMSSRAFSYIGQIEGKIFYTGFVGPRGYVIRGEF